MLQNMGAFFQLTFIESIGNIAQCSAMPANAPAVQDTRMGVDGGRLSYSSITVILSTPTQNQRQLLLDIFRHVWEVLVNVVL